MLESFFRKDHFCLGIESDEDERSVTRVYVISEEMINN